MTAKLADAEFDLKKLRALYTKYGAQQIINELKRMKPAKVGAPKQVSDGDLVDVYAFIEANRVVRKKSRVLQIAEEIRRTIQNQPHPYSVHSIRGMYLNGKKLVEKDSLLAAHADFLIKNYTAMVAGLSPGGVLFPTSFLTVAKKSKGKSP